FGAAFVLYGVAMSFFIGYVFTRREALAEIANAAMLAAALAHFGSLAARTVAAHRLPGHEMYVPWSNWFESFSFFALVIAVEYLIIERRRVPILGSFVSPIVFVMMAAAVHSPTGFSIPDLPPSLQSYWMSVHVPIMFVSYAAFAHAFAVGLAYLIQEGQLKSKNPSVLAFRLPPLEDLDHLIYGIIGWAFPALTVGLALGARWAYDAWGHYWNWDPKETWALATWLIYLVYLLMRLVGGWKGRKTAYLSLAGFGFVIFTYVGVNYLSQLHGFLTVGR
ncbi:MAG: c-type cytochrome biogenesis protein CcsB, partial [Elusimicrobia bacterium]|nr:c-type cytochrome biogenesis protein CcsB [Elusimicrobiota bacterium]